MLESSDASLHMDHVALDLDHVALDLDHVAFDLDHVALEDGDVVGEPIDLRVQTVETSDDHDMTLGERSELSVHVLEQHVEPGELFVAQMQGSMLVKLECDVNARSTSNLRAQRNRA